MSQLFEYRPETAPEDRARTGSQRARARLAAAHPNESAPPEKTFSYLGKLPVKAILPIGKADDLFDCGDGRCGARCHDILHEHKGEWYVACCFCGTAMWVKAVAGHLKPREAEFVFRDGRFAGMTVFEAASQPRGEDYIKWCATNHQRDAVRSACKKHMDAKTAPV
jgi:hypothetical protein